MPSFDGGGTDPGGSPEEGLLAFYGLVPWWLDTFTPDERRDIELMYAPLTGGPNALTRGHVTRVHKSAAEFLMALAHRYDGYTHSTIARRIHAKVAHLTNNNAPGCINGVPCRAYLLGVTQLVEAGNVSDAASLASAICDAIESEARVGFDLVDASPPPPAVYWDLAVLYRKHQAYAQEVAVIERWMQQFQHAGGHLDQLPGGGAELMQRLAQARALLAESQTGDQHA